MRPGEKRLGNGGILDARAVTLIGKSGTITPGLATGAEPVIGGVSVFTQPLQILQIQAEDKRDPENLTIIIDALPNADAGSIGAVADRVMIQGVLQWGSGGSQFGQPQNYSSVGTIQLSNEIVFDVGFGTAVVIGASMVQLALRYTASKRAPFAPGAVVGPAYGFSASVNYGSKNQNGLIAKTEPFVTLANAAFFIFNRAKYAYGVQLVWEEYQTVGPLKLDFLGQLGTPIFSLNIPAATLPLPIIPWPEGATFLTVTNASGAAAMSFVTCKQHLNL